MRYRLDPSPSLMSLARKQSGALSREQALGLGLRPASIKRLVDQGHWHWLRSGHYCVGDVTPRTWLWTGLMVAGPLSVVTSSWALHLEGLLSEPTLPVTILSPRHCRNMDEIRFVRRTSRGRGEPSRALVETALVDAWPDMTEAEFISVVAEAMRGYRTTLQRLATEAASRVRLTRRRQLEDCLGDMGYGVRSTLEADFLRLVQRPHGLPPARRQAEFKGRFLDQFYEEYGLAVETDGRRGHVGAGAFRDMERDNALAEAGIISLRFGWSDTRRRPCVVARQVADVLMVRGWPGPLVRCANCL